MTELSIFGHRLREWRGRLCLSQSQAAANLLVAVDTIRDWESGYRRPQHEASMALMMELVERRILAERGAATEA